LFSYCKGIIDLDAKVTHGALDFRVAEQDPDGPQKSGEFLLSGGVVTASA
jgi:hypothetical protein